MIVSTCSLNFSIPSRAKFILFFLSKSKGLVTTATVRIPISLAIFAITGEAPVPVPPPIPAVMNTISAPSSASVISAEFSSAAFAPTSGRAPAPRPLVSFAPIAIFFVAFDLFKAAWSVFTAMYSTSVFDAIILSTALHPPPPTPITTIFATSFNSFTISITTLSSYIWINIKSFIIINRL